MAKNSSLKNMLLTLSLICLTAAAALGVVFVLTKQPIEDARIAKINSAIAEVVPIFDNNPSSDVFTKELDNKSFDVYPAKKDGQIVAYAIKTFSNGGFGGRIELMVGFKMDGSIHSITVISHNETPGLGDKIAPDKSNFSLQFNGKNPENFKLLVKQDRGEVDAITASTISSRAYCDAVDRAYKVFKLCSEEQLK